MKRSTPRKATPWNESENMTATQAFLKHLYERHYDERHVPIRDSDESALVNSHIPTKCPHCGSDAFKRNGHTSTGVQRYRCVCGATFLPTTGTIFDEHRISISEWMEYCLNLFHHVSLTADSWSNKNAFITSRYWLQKIFITLEEYQNNMVLSDYVWLDETYYSVRSENIILNVNGSKLSGISRNKICIAVATDKRNSIFAVEGTGRPTQRGTLDIFRKHIAERSTLIHDGDVAHNSLVKVLSLESVVHTTNETKGLSDNDNPLQPVNGVHSILKKFLNAHSGFLREDIMGYLNLFAFVTNPPHNLLEKVEMLLDMAFQNPKLLRFRAFAARNSGDDGSE
jgi:hypothetical protein